MNVTVFGATGGTGRALVDQLLQAGHRTTAFVHHSGEPLGALLSGVQVVHGDVREFTSVVTAMRGQDAALVAVGVTPGRAHHVLSQGTANIVRAMTDAGARRLVVETGAGLTEHRDLLPRSWRIMRHLPPMRGMFDEKARQEAIIRASSLEWTIVRPSNLTNGPPAGEHRAAEALTLTRSASISRADVAAFMIAQLTSAEWLRKAVAISQ